MLKKSFCSVIQQPGDTEIFILLSFLTLTTQDAEISAQQTFLQGRMARAG